MSTASLYQRLLSDIHGIGWFALGDLSTGTGILRERGILSMPSSVANDDTELLARFRELSLEEQDSILTLSSGFKTEVEWYKRLDEASKTDAAKRLRQIYMRNCTVEPDSDSMTLGLEIARINHSCAPNAEIIFEEEKSVLEIVAIKDIRAGEEITITYCMPYEISTERRAELFKVYGFVCKCRICVMCRDCVMRSDTRRLLLTRGSKTLNEYFEALPILMQPLSPFPDMAARETAQRTSAAKSVLHTARQMECWISDEGITGAEVTKIYRQGMNAAWSLGDKTSSIYYLRKLVTEGRRAHVVDDEEVQSLHRLAAFIDDQ